MNKPSSIHCLEFFSGIGGLHYGFNLSGASGEILASFDMNTVANEVYKHNFDKEPINTGIERLSAQDIERFGANCWLMSPPCQAFLIPYTRGGNLLDDQDPRAKPLLHLVSLLPTLSTPPDYIFLENVLNFESSRSRHCLVKQLDAMNYKILECLLSPTQFGIPNDRLRYYLIARIRQDAPVDIKPYLERAKIYRTWPFKGEPIQFEVPALDEFMEKGLDIEKYRVPERDLMKSRNFRFDIVRPTDRRSACFTKAYGTKHFFTSGSIIQTKNLEFTDYDFSNPSSLIILRLRFFTPLEVAKLLAFPIRPNDSQSDDSLARNNCCTIPRSFHQPSIPPYLEFPEHITTIQRHKLLGNSLNCWVVGELMRCVLFAEV